MSKLLFDNDDVLVINPKLAKAIGLNEAIILQQIHYWIENKYCAGHIHLGRKWVYNTVAQWNEQFPFISVSTIKRTMLDLRDKGLIDVEKLSKDGLNHTNYYSINYAKLDALKVQFEPIDGVNLNQPNGSDWSEPNRTETTTKTTGSADKKSAPACDVQKVIDLYHQALPELPKARLMTDKRKRAILKMWKWVLTSTKTDGTPRATNGDEAMAWITGYFQHASKNDFLMGRTSRTGEHANWKCDIDFLLTDRGMSHVIEKTTKEHS